MKTTSVTVERNFHIMNDDRFIMEKISISAELEAQEDEQDILNILRETIVENFKAAYPNLDRSMNFDEVIQVTKHSDTVSSYERKNATVPNNSTHVVSEPQFYNAEPEKVEQKQIEQLIAECQTLTQLKEYELLSSMNKRYKVIYEEKCQHYPSKIKKQYE